MVYNGLWFVPLREALDAFFEKTSETTTGEVTLRLYKGNIEPVSRKSPYSLYSLNIASFTMGAEYDQKDARGFINLIGLPIQVRAQAAAAAHARDRSDEAATVGSGAELHGRNETLGRAIRERALGSLRALLRFAPFRPEAAGRRLPRIAGLRAGAGTRRAF